MPRHLKRFARRVPLVLSLQLSSCISRAGKSSSLSPSLLATLIFLSALQKLECLIAQCRGNTDYTALMNYLERAFASVKVLTSYPSEQLLYVWWNMRYDCDCCSILHRPNLQKFWGRGSDEFRPTPPSLFPPPLPRPSCMWVKLDKWRLAHRIVSCRCCLPQA